MATAVALAVLATGCGADDERDVVTVGAGSTSEQQVLAALTVVALDHADIDTQLALDLGGTIGLRREALRGSVDLYWDYTAAAWALGLRQQSPPADPEESFERVREADLRRNDLVWLEPSDANATLALFVDEEALGEDQAASMDWLARELSGQERTLCVDSDFRQRSGGLTDLAEVYPMDLDRVEVIEADESEAIRGVAEGRCFAGLGTATSGEAQAAGLVRVHDDLGVFPAFVVAPVAREGALQRQPRLASALEPITDLLDTATLARLNAETLEAESFEERRAVARRELAPYLGDA